MDSQKIDLRKRLVDYSLAIVKFVDSLSKGDMSTQVIAKQLIRSGTSVTANCIEAKSASSKKDYINFYTHALKSANESLFWISLLIQSGKADENDWHSLRQETSELANIIAASIITMKKNLEK